MIKYNIDSYLHRLNSYLRNSVDDCAKKESDRAEKSLNKTEEAEDIE